MTTVSVYTFASGGFRVVAGEHAASQHFATLRTYKGASVFTALVRARAGENDPGIVSALERLWGV